MKAKKSKKSKSLKQEQAKQAIDAAELSAPAEAVAPEAAAPAAPSAAAKAKAPAKETRAGAPRKARKEAKEKEAHLVPSLILQYEGREVELAPVVEAARAAFKAEHKRTPLTDLTVYIKPEDGAAYFVANGYTNGKIDL